MEERMANCLLIEHRDEVSRFVAALSLHEQLQRLAFFNVEELKLESFQLANCTFYISDLSRLSSLQRENLAISLTSQESGDDVEMPLIIVGTPLSEPEMRLMGLLKDPLVVVLNTQRIKLANESVRISSERSLPDRLDLH